MTICPHCEQSTAPGFACDHCQGRLSDPPVWSGVRTYSMTGIGIAAAVAVGAAALIGLVTAWSPLIGAQHAEAGTLSTGYTAIALGLIVDLAMMAPAGVLFIIWLWRARKNLDAFPNPSATLGAGWAIGAWFIPIANIVLTGRLVNGVARSTLFRKWTGVVTLIWCVTYWAGTLMPRFTPDPPVAGSDAQHAEFMRTTMLTNNLIESSLLAIAAGSLIALIVAVSRSQDSRIARANAAQWYVPAVPGAGVAS